MSSPSVPAEWVTQRERGSVTLLRLMSFISLRLGRRVGRCLLYAIVAYYFLFAPTTRRHSRDYLRRALGREPGPLDRYRHLLWFASVTHDRIYLLHGRYDLFDIAIEGDESVRERFRSGSGAILMGAHVGSFEITYSLGKRQPGLHVAMAMYEDNARKVNALLAAINPADRPQVIALGHFDAMLKLQECLERGAFVGVLGDRSLRNESGQVVDFLGAPAAFPTGAMRVAALLRQRVFFMAGLYCGGNRYRVVFEPLVDFAATPPRQRDAAVREAIVRYAALLEETCRAHPYNWFNFSDFWHATH